MTPSPRSQRLRHKLALPVITIAHHHSLLFLFLFCFALLLRFVAKVKAGLTTVSITIDKVGLKVRSLTDTVRVGSGDCSSSNFFDLASPCSHAFLSDVCSCGCCCFSDVQDAQTYINSYLTVSVTGQAHSQPRNLPCPFFFLPPFSSFFDDVCIL